MSRISAACLVAVASMVGCAGIASAQPSPDTAASAPTKGALYSDGQSGRYLLGGTWLFRPDQSDVGLKERWWRGVASTAGWSTVSVPNAYNAGDFSAASMNGWVGWYRRDFTVPQGACADFVPTSDCRWIVRFESVNYRATVWLNGHQLGSHTGAYLPFELDLISLRHGVNHLVVRVDNRRKPSDLPPGPYGGWWNYGGILREVYLRSVQRADLQSVQVRPVIRCPTCAADIQEDALVRNVTGSSQSVTLAGSYGHVTLDFGTDEIRPHGTWNAHASAVIAHPRLWSIDRPFLYRASLTLSDGDGRAIEGYLLHSGIRMIGVTRSGRLALNGRLLDLRGVDLHEQDIQLGAALDPAHVRRFIDWARALDVHVIRAHYPLNPQLEELADRDGILLWSEVPVWRVSAQYLSQPGWRAHAYQLLSENILTNQNHPSVMLWSIGNELPTPAGPGESAYISGAAATARRLDPTRPVAMAISSWPGVPCQAAYAPLDVIGYNDYFGYFDSGGGSTDDRDALSPFLDSLRACYPRKAIMVSEFGFDANRPGPVEERGTYAFQSNSIAYHLNVFASKRWLSGAILWLLQDFASSPGWDGGNPRGTPPFVTKGLVDLYGARKPAFSEVASLYRSTRQIAPATQWADR